MTGLDMVFRALGLDPQMVIQAISEVHGMAVSIAAKSVATDQKMERIEAKLDLIMQTLDVQLPPAILSPTRVELIGRDK